MTSSDTTLRSICPSRERPIDLIHLARQTGGSRPLESEILALMANHVAQALEWSCIAGRDAMPPLAHAIAGAARNVGAFALARAAGTLETRPGDATAVAAFQDEARRVLRFIEALDGRGVALTAQPAPTTCAA